VTHPLIIRPEAEQDMLEGRDWYEGQRQGLGAEFLTAVEEVFDLIREMPELYPPEYKSVRRAGVTRFPYVVYYRLVGEDIEVIAVQHGSRNPRRWRSRA
jgi:plasmid stabilization system protein ParE